VTLPPDYFEAMYAERDDPWGFRTRWYETRKRRLTMAALPDSHYRSVFEPGCSIGLLTTELAARSEQVVAMDVSDRALRQARQIVPANVQLRRGAVPADWPSSGFELIVLSEVGYYLDPTDCQTLAELAVESSRDLIAIHWRHPVADYPLTGDQVHSVIEACAHHHGLARVVNHVERDLRLDVWSSDVRSVAVRDELISS